VNSFHPDDLAGATVRQTEDQRVMVIIETPPHVLCGPASATESRLVLSRSAAYALGVSLTQVALASSVGDQP
jgi:hypothetical protein